MALSRIPSSECRDPENRSKSKLCSCGGHNDSNGKKTRRKKQKAKNLRSVSRKRS